MHESAFQRCARGGKRSPRPAARTVETATQEALTVRARRRRNGPVSIPISLPQGSGRSGDHDDLAAPGTDAQVGPLTCISAGQRGVLRPVVGAGVGVGLCFGGFG
jgi:hypothetical protein